jgi:hypothetical protein
MTFKDLQKLVQQSSSSNLEHTQLLERLGDKPFWIWDQKQHMQKKTLKQMEIAASITF